jgi:hypothetical protein
MLRQTVLGAKREAFTEVYSRLGDEDFVGNVLRLTGSPSLRRWRTYFFLARVAPTQHQRNSTPSASEASAPRARTDQHQCVTASAPCNPAIHLYDSKKKKRTLVITPGDNSYFRAARDPSTIWISSGNRSAPYAWLILSPFCVVGRWVYSRFQPSA